MEQRDQAAEYDGAQGADNADHHRPREKPERAKLFDGFVHERPHDPLATRWGGQQKRLSFLA